MMVKTWSFGISSKLTNCLLLIGSFLLPLAGVGQVIVPAAGSVAPPSRPVPVPTTTAAPTLAAPAADGWTLVRTIKLATTGVASLDRRGTLYVVDRQNNIVQLGAEGQVLNTYSPALPGHIAQLEAWNTTKILAFYDDRQQLLLLDRFLAPLTQVRTADFLDGTIRAATIAPDERLWLFDESNIALEQFDLAQQRPTITTPMDLLVGRSKPDFRFLRQYQNNVYLVDRVGGILVFDNLGNYRKKLPFSGLSYVGFLGDELYYVADNALHFFHLYNFTDRALPLPTADVQQVLVSEQYAYVLLPKEIRVYTLAGAPK
ncbi:hypothetical protein H8B15_06380 [Hymenobacter sp. BT507]|uniref:6-bladed beta-propeller n=1 Tax=Hymenobacter citatus TaxID=2763506 RepID=A0ABR7MII3_9BACT|nr:hypothetical protein [Hymenobacter citatus]MBC6610540.1 hypothetical protein [Hymenobacter citatus]